MYFRTASKLTALFISSPKENAERIAYYLRPIAKKYNLELDAFGTNLTDATSSTVGTLRLSDANGRWLNPAPVTPTNEAPYVLLSGSIRQSWTARIGALEEDDKPIFVAPGLMGGGAPIHTDHIGSLLTCLTVVVHRHPTNHDTIII